MIIALYLKMWRDHWRSLLSWAGVAVLMVSIQMSVYPSIAKSGKGFETFLENYPDAIKKIFRMQDYTTGPGFLSTELYSMMIPLILIAIGATWGASATAEEEEKGTADLLFAFPSFFMIIALSIPMVERAESLGIVRDNGARLTVLIIFFVFFGWPGFARLIRSQAMSLRERDFIMAAQSQGASNWRIITKEMLPNLWPTAIVFLSLSLPGYLAAEAVFSFLGVGINPPASTFGLVLSDAIKYWRSDPAYLIIPCAMLIAIVLALNLLGDAVRDALDSKSE